MERKVVRVTTGVRAVTRVATSFLREPVTGFAKGSVKTVVVVFDRTTHSSDVVSVGYREAVSALVGD